MAPKGSAAHFRGRGLRREPLFLEAPSKEKMSTSYPSDLDFRLVPVSQKAKVFNIVEIIKRDFTGDGNDRALKRQKTDAQCSIRVSSGPLHQYNEYGSLESLILERSKGCKISESEKQARSLAHQTKVMQEFLDEERKRPRQSHTPWLKIYLSPNEIPPLKNRANVSYQETLTSGHLTRDALPLTNDTLPPSGLSALNSTLVKPQEDILEEELDVAPI
ncbi:hypothetical protein PCANC_04131 [Puccinia coronata f. sp. avenae]|uniref:Uncharacterized protein n=1 Tax=Puccinia coronata f. sp. avenae TaxID=200324 RepID=A0A2N5W782_9BASI|nr:hypothetical protein PCANC_04131 [Puccinia coronata f. sp. avenae]